MLLDAPLPPRPAAPMCVWQAKEFYGAFVENVRSQYVADRVKDGVFGAMMNVALVNDGPVTFVVDSETD